MIAERLKIGFHHSKGGRPKSSGLNSVSELRTIVASFRMSSETFGSGTITTCMPALTAATTPFGASSMTNT